MTNAQRATILLSSLSLLATFAAAQCSNTWVAQGGPDAAVRALERLQNGDLVIGGDFTSVAGVAANYVARWDGAQWHAMGAGFPWRVETLELMSDGSLVAGGDFVGVWRWDGIAWQQLGTQGGSTRELVALPGGVLVAAGNCALSPLGPAVNAAMWNGSSWVGLATGLSHESWDLTRLPNGDLVFGGIFTHAGGQLVYNVARWNGSAWSGMGGADNMVIALDTLPNGDVIAGGNFTWIGGATANHVARWDGTQWHAMGAGVNGSVLEVRALPNGDVLVGGQFTTAGGAPAASIARWNGSAWLPLGAGVGSAPSGPYQVWEIAPPERGEVFVGGLFPTAGGNASPNLARLLSTCPASVVDLGGGCPSSGGANTLAATSWPWVGSVFRATGTGLPTTALVVAVTGFQTIGVPLSQVLPQGVPGCNLLVSPDSLDVLLTLVGEAASQLAVPLNPGLIGVSLQHQFVPLELDAGGNVVAITSSNALLLTLGAF